MTEFIDETAILGKQFRIDDLPIHYKESAHLKNVKELFPDETTINILDHIYVENFRIQSNSDITKILLSDCMYGFHTKVYKYIFMSIDEFWLENPNSRMIEIPNKEQSWLAKQIVVLLTEEKRNVMLACMRMNLIELFDYIIVRDNIDTEKLETPLLYYAAYNRNMEILIHGIDLKIPFTEDILRPVINNNDVVMFRMLLDKNISIHRRGEENICENASLEIFVIFLEKYISEKKDPANLLDYSIKNVKNFEELVLRRDISSAKNKKKEEIYDLYDECILRATDVKVLHLIEEYFEITNATFQREYPLVIRKIEQTVLYEDNYDLFVYLMECGYHVNRDHYNLSVRNRCMKITPGFVKKYLN